MKYSLQIVAMSVLCTMASAETVRLDLGAMGCRELIAGSWGTDFDLGVQFSAIERVSIEWSGSMKGNLLHFTWGETGPIEAHDLFVIAELRPELPSYPPPSWAAGAMIRGGGDTYPALETFDWTSDIILSRTSTGWDPLMDGKSHISLRIDISSLYQPQPAWVEWGKVQFDKVVLAVEGTAVPEPLTLAMMAVGGLVVRRKK